MTSFPVPPSGIAQEVSNQSQIVQENIDKYSAFVFLLYQRHIMLTRRKNVAFIKTTVITAKKQLEI